MTNPIDVHRGTTYMVWCDHDKRLATSSKIKNAVAAYSRKYGTAPVEILVHPSALETRSDVPLRAARFVNSNSFYLPIPDT